VAKRPDCLVRFSADFQKNMECSFSRKNLERNPNAAGRSNRKSFIRKDWHVYIQMAAAMPWALIHSTLSDAQTSMSGHDLFGRQRE
jgi:hypothetical protein